MSLSRLGMTSAATHGGGERAVELELPAHNVFNAVGRLVVGGLASRADLCVDQVEDLQLAVEALLCRPPADGPVTVVLRASEPGLVVRLGPFAPARAERARILKMLSTLVDEAVVQDSGDGEWMVLRAAHGPSARGSS